MEKRVDTVVSTAALIAVVAFFLWIAIPVVRTGLSHADDAFFAILAKNIAMGKGYGYEKSSDQFMLMDPYVNATGPALVLPIALLIKIFGPLEWLPGAATLAIFMSQMFYAAFLLSRRFGRTPTCGFFFTILLLLILASSNNWYFGAFLGETVAFAFVLIGMALLTEAKQDRTIVIAALCFSLSFLTKQICLFAAAGILGAWLIISLYRGGGRKPMFRQMAIVILIGSSLPLLFEVWKLATLGLRGYMGALKATLQLTHGQAIGTGDPGARLTTFLGVIRNSYMSLVVIVGLALGSLLILALLRRKQKQAYEGAGTFASFAWAGAAAYLAYVLVFSILWRRYFWIGIAVMLTAISCPLLAVGSKLRTVIIAVTVLVVLMLGLYRKPLLVRAGGSGLSAERVNVMKVLDEHPELPYVAHAGTSLNDILYLRGNVGIWTVEANLAGLRHRDFIALINDVFTPRNGDFYRSVTASCEQLTPQGRLNAYLCTERFWATYPVIGGNSSLSATKSLTGDSLYYYGVVDRRDCDGIGGWVMNPIDPQAILNVELYVDDRLIETQPARNPRLDLVNWLGSGNYGFSFNMPSTYKDAMRHTAAVKVAGSDYSVPFFEGVFSGFECYPK